MAPNAVRHRELLDHLRTLTPAEAAAEMLALEQDRDRLRGIVAALLPADTMTPVNDAAPVSAANAGEAE